MRMAWAWVGAILVVAAAIVGGVAIANATVFSASSFARDYLDALRTDQVDEVLALPGVSANGLDARMLDAAAVEAFEYTLVSDTESSGVHRVTVSFSSGGADTADGPGGEATLAIERVGTRFGLFPEWGFAASPITALTVTTTGDTRVTVGELPLEVADGGPVTFAALTPGVYTLGQDSEFLTAEPVVVTATGAQASTQLDVVPTEHFLAEVQAAVEADLTACAEQTVLFPSPCPFGFAIENRVVSEPHWSISEMPTSSIAPSDAIGVWAVPRAAGVAHLTVEVQSLFDGSVSTLEEDVPFEAGYLIAFDGDQVVLDPKLR